MSLKTARLSSFVCTTIFIFAGCGTRFQAINLAAQSSSSIPHSPGLILPPPPLPVEEPELQDYPNTENTGVPPGVTLKPSGGITVTVAGTVIDGLDIKGVVHINANNVTLKRSKITAAGYVQVQVQADLTGVVVEDCEINGVGTGNDGSLGIQGPGKFLRNNIYNVENGVTPDSGALIQDNYIHDLKASGTPQYDGVQIDGGASNILIHHNSIINGSVQTSAIMIDNFFGSVSGIRVDQNLLGGGTYTVQVDASTPGSSISNVSFTGNSMRSGTAGFSRFNDVSPVFTGNFDDSTGKPLN